MKRWARKWDCCRECKKTDSAHASKGLCRKCYMHPYNRRYREEHLEELTEYKHHWDAVHPEPKVDRERQWRKNNPERIRAIWRKKDRLRRARKANATIGPVDETAIYERDKVCVYCGSGEDLTIDHVVALASGGAHCQDNLVVACKHCNSSKSVKSLDNWLRS